MSNTTPVADERAAQQPAAGNQYHVLKTDPEVFQAVLSGAKTFEIRLNDRGYAVGDVLGLRETKHTGAQMRDGAPLEYTGRECQRFVSHVLTGYGLADGWCCLSFALPHADGASAPVADERAANDYTPTHDMPHQTGVGEWCAPGPAAEQRRTWLLRFADVDRGDCIYYDEQEARGAFARAEARGWNCYLFEFTRRAALASAPAAEVCPICKCPGGRHSGGSACISESAAVVNERLRKALSALVDQWDKYKSTEYQNQEDAYYKLDKYARPLWKEAQSALADQSVAARPRPVAWMVCNPGINKPYFTIDPKLANKMSMEGGNVVTALCAEIAPHARHPVAGEAQPVAWMSDQGQESLRQFGQTSVVGGGARPPNSEFKHPIYAAPQVSEAEDAKRWRWIWNHAENVSFSYRVDPITRSTVSGLHCGSLKDVVDSARAGKDDQ